VKISVAAIAVMFAVGVASASPIGFLGIGSQGFVQASLTSINFTADPSALPVPGPPWNGSVNAATTLSFSGGPLMTGEGILINNGQAFGTPPPPGAGLFNPFLQFELHPNLLYILTSVDAGASNTNCAALANGQSCSILVAGTPSPVILQRNGSSTNVSISLNGFVIDGVGSTPWTGGFSATIAGMLPIDIVHFFCGADATCTAGEAAASPTLDVRSVSGSFFASSVPVPEPNTLSLFLAGGGLMLIGIVCRRPGRSTR